MYRISERLKRSDWLLLVAPPVLLLVILEVARHLWLATALPGYAASPVPLVWAIAEVVLVAGAAAFLVYRRWVWWRAQSERAAVENRSLQETIATLREEKASLKEAGEALHAESIASRKAADMLRQEKAALQETVEALRSQSPITFVTGDHPSLLDLLLQGQLDEVEALDYVGQAARVLATFHVEGIPYVLAPDTVVVDQDRHLVYLRQRLIGPLTATTFYAGFSPPEALSGSLTVQTDVFALGALLYALYTRQMPSTGNDLAIALEHLNVASGYLGVDYLLRKALWPQAQFRLGTAIEFATLLESIIERQQRAEGAIEGAVVFDVGADFNVGLFKGRNRGRNARDNEDRLFWDMDEQRGLCLLIIADGITHSDIGSGYNAAALFAELAGRFWGALQRNPAIAAAPANALARLFADANRRIVCAIAEHLRGRVVSNETTMATAACAALCHGARATVANLGDVRAYLATPHWAGRVTYDDSALSAALRDPSVTLEQRAGLSGSTLNDYLGRWEPDARGEPTSVQVEPHIASLVLVPGETLVLVSDGAYGATRDSQEPFEDTLLKILASTDDAQVAAFRLMSVANQRSGSDNISCIVCRCLAPDIHL